MSPLFDWIQVEVTTHCNGHCAYCPHTVYQGIWQNRHMLPETFARLLPVFKHTQLVFLQGWGEPLLNPDFFQMVLLAKAAGCKVGTTTNGILLDETTAVKLIECGVDIVAFSITGSSESNDRIREGTSLQGILNGINLLNHLKKESNSVTPKIHIAYLLLRSMEQEAMAIPDLLKDADISEVIISTLDFVPSRNLLELSLQPQRNEDLLALRDNLEAMVQVGRKNCIEIHYQIPFLVRKGIWCSENISRALFVSANGDVSPCVFTNLPVDGCSHFVNGNETELEQMIFGNVNNRPLLSIWRRKEYRKFRNSFLNNTPSDSCVDCPKLRLEAN